LKVSVGLNGLGRRFGQDQLAKLEACLLRRLRARLGTGNRGFGSRSQSGQRDGGSRGGMLRRIARLRLIASANGRQN